MSLGKLSQYASITVIVYWKLLKSSMPMR